VLKKVFHMIVTYCFQITIHLAVWGFAEFAFCLTRMNPDMVYLHLDSGFLNVSYYKFDTDDVTG
jgi:transformation/transcription domain-associated protein